LPENTYLDKLANIELEGVDIPKTDELKFYQRYLTNQIQSSNMKIALDGRLQDLLVRVSNNKYYRYQRQIFKLSEIIFVIFWVGYFCIIFLV